jgi:HEAT repeat protein
MRTRLLIVPAVCVAAALAVCTTGCGKKQDYSVSGQMDALTHEDPDVRSTAATVLGKYGADAKEAVPGLVALLKDKDKHVRRSAAYALARFGKDASDAIPGLKEALRDEDPKVREAATYALKEIQNPRSKKQSDKKENKRGGK